MSINNTHTTNKYGYIYLRDNEWYEQRNVIKMGIASHARNRDNTYITGEIKRGYYRQLIEIPHSSLKFVDNLLKYHFKKYNILFDGGTEFYDRCILDNNMIIDFLNSIIISYRILSQDEIDKMKYFNYDINNKLQTENINVHKIKHIINSIDIKKLINTTFK